MSDPLEIVDVSSLKPQITYNYFKAHKSTLITDIEWKRLPFTKFLSAAFFKDAKLVSFWKDGKKEKCGKLRTDMIISVVAETVLKAVIYQQNTSIVRYSGQITNLSVGLTTS